MERELEHWAAFLPGIDEKQAASKAMTASDKRHNLQRSVLRAKHVKDS